MRPGEKKISVIEQQAGWLVRVTDARSAQEYACTTERMARQFAAIFERAAEPLWQADFERAAEPIWAAA